MDSKDKPHFPAICRSIDGTYFLTNTLYHDSMKARVELGSIYVRLANEIGPILLDTTKHEPPKPLEKNYGKTTRNTTKR